MRLLRTSLIAYLLCISFVAKADTLDYREQVIYLPDQTQIAFSIGGFGLIRSEDVSYLSMVGKEEDGEFINTAPFHARPGDLVRFVRWIAFEDKDQLVFYGKANSEGWDEFVEQSEVANFKEITPKVSSFASNSTISYILELRLHSNDSVLARVDTIQAFKDFEGKMRWRHRLRGGSIAHIALPIQKPIDVYFHITRVDDLPKSVSLRHKYYVMENMNDMSWLGYGEIGPLVDYKPISSE